jgi:hypothetical protein
MTSPSGRTQDAISFYVTSDAIAFWVNLTKYPVTGYTLADPSITVNVDLPGGVLTLTGTRSGETLDGNANMPAQSGTGTWAATKIGGAPLKMVRPSKTSGSADSTRGVSEWLRHHPTSNRRTPAEQLTPVNNLLRLHT